MNVFTVQQQLQLKNSFIKMGAKFSTVLSAADYNLTNFESWLGPVHLQNLISPETEDNRYMFAEQALEQLTTGDSDGIYFWTCIKLIHTS